MGCCQSGFNREESNIESNFEGHSSRYHKENDKGNKSGEMNLDSQPIHVENLKFEETSVISNPNINKSEGQKKKYKPKKLQESKSINETDILLDRKLSQG